MIGSGLKTKKTSFFEFKIIVDSLITYERKMPAIIL